MVLRCTIRDQETGYIETLQHPMELIMYPLATKVNITSQVRNIYVKDETILLKASVFGGTGEFSYNWYIKDSDGKTVKEVLNTASDSLKYTLDRLGEFTFIFEVKDKITGNVTSDSKTINVLPFVLNLTVEGETSFYYPGLSKLFKAVIRGGSGDFTYNWYLKDEDGNVLRKEENISIPQVIFSFPKLGYNTLVCSVTDNVTKNIVEEELSLLVRARPVEFTDIQTEENSAGKFCTASIALDKPSKITLTLYHSPGSGNPRAEASIGGSTTTLSSSGSKTIIVTLSAGYHTVQLKLLKSSSSGVSGNAMLTITDVDNGGIPVGNNGYLTISM